MSARPSLFILFFLIAILGLASSMAGAQTNQNLVYHGRIVKPDGQPLNAGNVEFTVQVLSPAPSLCVLWEEKQTLPMTGAMGTFNLELGELTHRVNGVTNFSSIFMNAGTLTSLSCGNGSTSYSPSATDERSLNVSFNDGGTVVNLASMPIKSVPYALQASQIGGYGISNLVRLSGTSSTNLDPLQLEQVAKFPTVVCATNEILKWNGTGWACAADATGGSPSDAAYAAKGIVQFDTDLATSGIALTAGVAKLPAVGTAGTYGSGNQIPVLTTDAKGRVSAVTNTALTLVAADIPALDAAKITTGTLPLARGGTGATTIAANKFVVSNGTGTALQAFGCTVGQVIDFDVTAIMQCRTIGGDVSGTMAALSVDKIKGVAVTTTSLAAQDILQYNGTAYVNRAIPTCSGSQALSFNGTTYSCVSAGAAAGDASYVAKGVVEFNTDAATSGITVASGIAAVNSGVGANQIVKLDGSGRLPAVDGRNITNLNLNTSINPWINGGNALSGAGTLGSTTAQDVNLISNSLARMTITSGGNIGIGQGTPTAKLQIEDSSTATSGYENRAVKAIMSANPGAASSAGYFGITGQATSASSLITSGTLLGINGNGNFNGTGTIANVQGVTGSINNSSTGTISDGRGLLGIVSNGTGATLSQGYGTTSDVYNYGTMSEAIGVSGLVTNNTGTIGSARGLSTAIIRSAGSITNGYGLYIDAIQATNKWSVYANDATAPSYFAGNVGIGTATPGSALDVVGNAGVSNNLFVGNNLSVNQTGFIYWGGAGNTFLSANGSSTTSANYIGFNTAGTEKMRVDSSGTVGIGTSSPSASALLDVSSTTKGILIPRMTTVQRDAIVSPATGLQVFNVNTAALNFYDGLAWQALGVAGGGTTATSNGGTGITSYTAGDILYATSATTLAKLPLGATGSILYAGASAPSWTDPGSAGLWKNGGNALSGTGYIGSTTNQDVTVVTNSLERMTVLKSGNVGIGTNNPTSKLHIEQSVPGAAVGVNLRNTGAGGSSGYYSSNPNRVWVSGVRGDQSDKYVIQDDTGGTLPFLIEGGAPNATLYLKSDGNVGVGTNAPTSPLHVVRSVSSTSGSVVGINSVYSEFPATDSSAVGYGINSELNLGNNVNYTSAQSAVRGYVYTNGNGNKAELDAGNFSITHDNSSGNATMNGTVTELANLAGTIASATGSNNYIRNANAGTMTSVNGVSARIRNVGGGSIATAHGLDVKFETNAAGNIGTGVGVYVANPTKGGSGAVTNYYGIYLEDPANATNSYSIYSAGGKNYFAGKVGIGTSSPAASAAVDITSTTQGFLLPRMTTVQRDAITGPGTGLQIYNVSTNQINFYDGASWTALSTGGGSYLATTGGTLSGGLNMGSNNISAVGSTITGSGAMMVQSGGSNTSLTLASTGGGAVIASTNTGVFSVNSTNGKQFEVEPGSPSTVNYVTVTGAIAAGSPIIGTAGADTNINLSFAPKGSGSTVFANGNVGIGTSGPADKLTVVGSASFSGTTKVAAGTAPLPGLAASADTSTGLRLLSGVIGFSTTGNNVAQFAASNLDVYVPIRAVNCDATNACYSFLGDTNTGMFSPTADTVAMTTGGTERLRVDNSGNVGIGTTMPVAGIDVFAPVQATGLKVYATADSVNRTQLRSQRSDGTAKSEILVNPFGGVEFNTGEGALNDFSSMYTTLYLSRDGAVEIGTKNFDVTFGVNPDSYTASASQSGFTVTGSGTAFNAGMIGGPFTWKDGLPGGIVTAVGSATSLTVSISRTHALAPFTISHAGLNVKTDGLVGIGTSTPATALQVNGEVNIDSENGQLSVGAAGGTNFSTNVWYDLAVVTGGMSTPGADMEFSNGYDRTMYIDGGNGGIYFKTTPNADGNYLHRLAIQGDGKVGIGTASPQGILDISSTVSGVVLPRMTKAQRNAMTGVVAGTAIYQTNATPGLRVYNGANWVRYTETTDP